jgi:anaerobic magnesium-protoporphyrin IX monomethyl ester cyclase
VSVNRAERAYMKIFIVDPPQQVFKYFLGHVPSPAVVALAAYMEREGHEVKILDATTFNDCWGDLERAVREGRPDIVGISNNSSNTVNNAFHTAALVKLIDPGIVVVGGGAHMTALPEESLRANGAVDYIVRGEGELTFSELARAIKQKDKDLSSIRGLAYLEDGRFVQTPDRPLMDGLDSLPMPAYHLMPLLGATDYENYIMPYYFPTLGMDPYKAVFISTARGCFGRCRFCSETSFWHHVWRARSARLMVDEMELLAREFGRTNFYFVDNSFNWSKDRVAEFIDELSARNLGDITFWFQTRAEQLLRDRALIPKLKRLGLYQISFGVETASQSILDDFDKNQNIELTRQAMQVAKEHDLVLLTNVMWGHRDDTEQTLLETYYLVKDYADIFALQIFTPVPGTPYYDYYLQNDLIKDYDWDHWDMFTPVVETKAVPHKEMLRTAEKVQGRYHLRPRILYNTFLSKNPYIRRNYRSLITLIHRTLTNTQHKHQTNYMPFEEYMKKKGYLIEKSVKGTCLIVGREGETRAAARGGGS